MHRLFDDVALNGIFRSGEVYILTQSKSRSCHLDPLRFIYVIKSESEILPALELETISMKEYYDFTEFLGCKKISGDCHVFRFLCREKPAKQESVFALYLHRMLSLQDAIKIERRLELEE